MNANSVRAEALGIDCRTEGLRDRFDWRPRPHGEKRFFVAMGKPPRRMLKRRGHCGVVRECAQLGQRRPENRICPEAAQSRDDVAGNLRFRDSDPPMSITPQAY